MTWYNTVSAGDWVTWEPGRLVSIGDVGRFNRQRRFEHWKNLRDYDIDFQPSAEESIAPRMYVDGRDFRAEPGVGAEAGPVGASFTVVARKRHACVLQIRRATESHLLGVGEVLQGIKNRIGTGPRGADSWPLDSVVVVERIRAKGGFAAISRAAGSGLELKAAGKLPAFADLFTAGARLRISSASSGFLLYEFRTLETPIFGAPIRVRRDLLDRLLPWRHDGPYIIDPEGRCHYAGHLPTQLPRLKPEDRSYDPARSAMTLDEFASMQVEDLFEKVTSLPAAHRVPVLSIEAIFPAAGRPQEKFADFTRVDQAHRDGPQPMPAH